MPNNTVPRPHHTTNYTRLYGTMMRPDTPGGGAPKASSLIQRVASLMITINPNAQTSERWRENEAYPARLLIAEVYSEDRGVPAGRLVGDIGSAGAGPSPTCPQGQLPGNIVMTGPPTGRPCPHCPGPFNIFTATIGHTKNSKGQVRPSSRPHRTVLCTC